jgi:hypothetical protein
MSTDSVRASELDIDAVQDSFIHVPELILADGFEMTRSWTRAQQQTEISGPINPVQHKIALPRHNGEIGGAYTVSFLIQDGRLRADCGCQGFNFGSHCCHILHYWWLWARGRLDVIDVDTGRSHPHPPAWLSVSEGRP